MKVYILVKEHVDQDGVYTLTILKVFRSEKDALKVSKKLSNETYDYLLEYPGETATKKIYISEIDEGFGKGFETGIKSIGYESFIDHWVYENILYDESEHTVLECWRYSVEEWEVQ